MSLTADLLAPSHPGRRGDAPTVGLAVRTPRVEDIPRVVRAAEELGYASIWFADSPRFPDVFVAMALAAGAARTLSVGCAVTNLETRDPVVVANAMATLAALLPGRVLFALGRGHSAVVMIGRKPTPLDQFARRFELVKQLMAGHAVNLEGRSFRLAVSPVQPVPLLVAGDGRQTRRLAGAIADGAIINAGAVPHLLAEAASEVRRAAASSGRSPVNASVFAWCRVAVASTEAQALAALREHFGGALVREAKRILGGTHRESVGPEASQPLLDETLRSIAVVGSPGECQQRIGSLLRVEGVSSLVVALADDDPVRGATTFAEAVLRSG